MEEKNLQTAFVTNKKHINNYNKEKLESSINSIEKVIKSSLLQYKAKYTEENKQANPKKLIIPNFTEQKKKTPEQVLVSAINFKDLVLK